MSVLSPGCIKTYFALSDIIVVFSLFVVLQHANSQNATDPETLQIETKLSEETLLFYNVENLFDALDDSLTNDDEFTPFGTKNWNAHKLNNKLRSIYKVLIAAGKWSPPALVCFAEIENEYSLQQLIHTTPLKELDYKVLHYESPDKRGIDVALIYRRSVFEVLESEPIEISFPFDTNKSTRDILYVKGLIMKDTIHLFINHWPSRWGGVESSAPYRMQASKVLKKRIDSVLTVDTLSNVLVLGDFNDEITDQSLQNLLSGSRDTESCLVPLDKTFSPAVEGTIKYNRRWYTFDHAFASRSLVAKRANLEIVDNESVVFSPEFLLIEDSQGLGFKPHRTYNGPNYIGGYSDHFPIFVKIREKSNE